MAKGLADPLTSEADEVGHTNAAESVLNSTHTKMDTSFVTRAGHSQPLVGAASLATNSIQPTSHAFGSYARHNHECVECGHLYDRVQRARDCANRDRGLTPYVCGARCGRLRCTKAYSFEALLREHLASLGNRVQCSQCLSTVSRKNIARHRKEVHYS
ncbi:hypothetical protein M408DRAFT_117721 [Serendipita vermifera MAFF 305830]|uniref:C2H2-type domain-containing protein n=1 Tax=Serendipita vermifera MAFF 305830 TaxID=933852 RepID=A0A0C2WU93_SERVB|nr:hypothetical protein M408DRAFT_117721 [Serendipita vermifera MAFF 305830]